MYPCPLCKQIPEDIYHIILNCKFVINMWKKLESTLHKILPIKITSHELAFGIQARIRSEENKVTLRNYLTFTLRNLIMNKERASYHKPGCVNNYHFMTTYNNKISENIQIMNMLFRNLGKSTLFYNIVTSGNFARIMPDQLYYVEHIMK